MLLFNIILMRHLNLQSTTIKLIKPNKKNVRKLGHLFLNLLLCVPYPQQRFLTEISTYLRMIVFSKTSVNNLYK